MKNGLIKASTARSDMDLARMAAESAGKNYVERSMNRIAALVPSGKKGVIPVSKNGSRN